MAGLLQKKCLKYCFYAVCGVCVVCVCCVCVLCVCVCSTVNFSSLYLILAAILPEKRYFLDVHLYTYPGSCAAS